MKNETKAIHFDDLGGVPTIYTYDITCAHCGGEGVVSVPDSCPENFGAADPSSGPYTHDEVCPACHGDVFLNVEREKGPLFHEQLMDALLELGLPLERAERIVDACYDSAKLVAVAAVPGSWVAHERWDVGLGHLGPLTIAMDWSDEAHRRAERGAKR